MPALFSSSVRLTILLTAGLLLPAVAAAQTSLPPRPNFIVFIADDLSWDDCGAYGRPQVGTPNIDRLARDGLRFDSAFLTCSSCSPSRASILTGRYPHNTGAEQLHWPLPAEQTMVSEPLRSVGYWTAAAGKWHLGKAAKGKFDLVAEGRADQWLPALKKRPAGKPFFLWLASTDPHRPYKPGATEPPHDPSKVVVPPYLPDVPETRQDLADYYDAISRLDRDMGEVLAELDHSGAAYNTFIVFLSDNGRPFPRCKTTVYDSGIKTPFIIRWPRQVRPDGISASLVSSIDIAPTMLELAGVAPSSKFQGVSLVPVLSDTTANVRSSIMAEHNWHDYTSYDRAVRTDRFKYIRNGYLDLPLTPPADAVSSPTFQAMRRLQAEGKLTAAQQVCFQTPRPAEELYDVGRDPHELHNLAADPRNTSELAELRKLLDEWQQQTHDCMPAVRTPDEFDRQTGKPLGARRARVASPELRAEKID
ncbi:MAG TPA: sulfatase [Pirellulales bacterium]|nr:sulfatase [Pirellulales bacterium]